MPPFVKQDSATGRAAGPDDTPVTLPEALAEVLNTHCGLPSLPSVVMQIVTLADSPDTNLQEFTAVIERDPALTLRMLGLANSVFHAYDTPVETCHEAITRLGVDATLSVALGFGLAQQQSTRVPGLDLNRFWQRALISALTSHMLAKHLAHPSPGRAFTLGLLQDIGMLALDACLPRGYAALLSSTEHHEALSAAELKAWGCDHALVGAWLAQHWGLPKRLVRGIADSHLPLAQTTTEQRCVNASGPLAEAWLDGLAESVSADDTLMIRILQRLSSTLEIDQDALIERLCGLQDTLPTTAELMHITCPVGFDAIGTLLRAKQQLHAHHLKLSQQLLDQHLELERLHQRQADLTQRVRHDTLTGLYNRAHLEALLEQHFREALDQRLALSLVFIDLDFFKQLNDRYGHRLGDEVLKGFAGLLRELMSPTVLGGRYGGEEFLLFLPGGGREAATRLAETLQQRMATHALARSVDHSEIRVSASMGVVSLADGDFVDADDLIQAADQAMYVAKRAGRGRIVHYGDGAVFRDQSHSA
ncbi:diguanylate cyclase (GGDEF) domain-containing protein [Franzmannia pantelleriensis]|uniref:diguanylate cyclase n=1 Tax=Franzmannia pantelleriensis TaxID=48727 RepID=A0A1G9MDP3_9GAMM|nr:GGDEF domain-containing protein [Halomonas pantelleriensis]SDL72037.1 diguanylate cyclase (GGDEF) domain-containing protein [Halomonas pantelleriensis]